MAYESNGLEKNLSNKNSGPGSLARAHLTGSIKGEFTTAVSKQKGLWSAVN